MALLPLLVVVERKKPLADELPTLSAQVADLVRQGVLDPFDPAYDVALVAIAVGYGGLSRAQRRLFDRVVAPTLSGTPPVDPTQSAETSQRAAITLATPTPPWRPIREAPGDTDIELAVSIAGKPSALTFPCRKEVSTWISHATGRPVYIRPTHWREWSAKIADE